MREIFSSKKINIKNVKEKKNIIIILKISLLGGKEQEIKLNLIQKNSDMNEINIELCNKLNFLEKNMKEMKDNFSEKINYLENIISNQKNEINELKKWKENYDNEIRQIIKNKKDKESLKNIDSKIIKNKKKLIF